MKKILFFLIFLGAIGAVFFLGWVQLTVPPGSYGVMYSKTHGLESRVIRGGDFLWLWYKVIPANAKISVYSINPVKHPIRNSGSLNSGRLYASLAGLEADFSWEIAGDFSFSLKPEALPNFTEREGIDDQDGLRKAEEDLAGKMENLIMDRLRTYAVNENEEKLESLILAASLPELNMDIEAAFPEIENFNCTLRTVRYPDFELYRSVKELYGEYLQRQNELLNPRISSEAENNISSKLRFDELERYGELLTRYPVLLDFLALEKNSGE